MTIRYDPYPNIATVGVENEIAATGENHRTIDVDWPGRYAGSCAGGIRSNRTRDEQGAR
jgi:hypothetical protein